MTENRRIVINVLATYGRSLYGLVIGLFCGRWALMALGEVDYGLNGLVGGLMAFIAFFNGVLSVANSRFYAYSIGAAKVAADKVAALDDCQHWFNTAVGIHSVIPTVLVAIGYPLGIYAIENWLTIPSDRVCACVWVFRFLCVACFIGMINVPFYAMYTAKQYIAELTVYQFVVSTLNAIVLYYMVTHPSAWLVKYAAWGCLSSVVPQLIICIRACKIFPECHLRISYMWDLKRIREVGAYSGWQILGTGCNLLRTQGISIVVNKFFGARMNAAQAIGNTVQGQCNTLAAAMQGAFTPVIIQAYGAGDYDKMRRFAFRTCKFNILLSALFMIPLALELPEVLRLWLKTPPAYAVGLCYCAFALYLVECCTFGHMVAVNATNKIKEYMIVMSSVNVFTLPIAVIVGFASHNVYAVIAAVVFMQAVNSAGRVLFARKLVNMSVKEWTKTILLPSLAALLIVGLIGYLPQMVIPCSFWRICLTTLICEMVFLPLTWFVLFSSDERLFVKEKIGKRFFGGISRL